MGDGAFDGAKDVVCEGVWGMLHGMCVMLVYNVYYTKYAHPSLATARIPSTCTLKCRLIFPSNKYMYNVVMS